MGAQPEPQRHFPGILTSLGHSNLPGWGRNATNVRTASAMAAPSQAQFGPALQGLMAPMKLTKY